MKTRLYILVLSIIYCICLLIILTGSHYKSPLLNPFNSEYRYISGNLVEAIETEPLSAKYHMEYALKLSNTLPSNALEAKSQLIQAKYEFLRASRLKPYDKIYKKTFNEYNTWIDAQL